MDLGLAWDLSQPCSCQHKGGQGRSSSDGPPGPLLKSLLGATSGTAVSEPLTQQSLVSGPFCLIRKCWSKSTHAHSAQSLSAQPSHPWRHAHYHQLASLGGHKILGHKLGEAVERIVAKSCFRMFGRLHGRLRSGATGCFPNRHTENILLKSMDSGAEWAGSNLLPPVSCVTLDELLHLSASGTSAGKRHVRVSTSRACHEG